MKKRNGSARARWRASLAAALITGGLLLSAGSSAAGDESTTSYASGRFAFGIDGTFAGFIKKVSAGSTDLKSDLSAPALDSSVRKHLATISHEPLTIELSMGSGPAMWEWIKASWDQGITPKSAIVRGSGGASVALAGAYVQSVTFPGIDDRLDPASALTITLGHKGLTPILTTSTPRPAVKESSDAKKWGAASFRLEIDGLPCDRVAKIDSFTWEQKSVSLDAQWPGERSAQAPTKIRISVDARDRGAWDSWYQQSKKLGPQRSERAGGSLKFLGPDLAEELGSISLRRVGILSLEPGAGVTRAESDELTRFSVELYVEELHIDSYGR